MDLVMKEMDGIEATRKIIEEWPEAKIIIVTSFIDDDKVYPALEAGAKSYLLKTSNASEIREAIRSTYNGQSILQLQVTGKLMNQFQKTGVLAARNVNREGNGNLIVDVGRKNKPRNCR